MLEESGWTDSPTRFGIPTYDCSHSYKENHDDSMCGLANRLREDAMLPDPPDNACKLCLRKLSEGGK